MELRLSRGFTLVELSIVLVIIGLIVGGVLVGQDLIRAAGVRATIAQIENYNTAANTFRGKYGYLPGDIKDPDASNFGFAARGPYPGEGDGNGKIEGSWYCSTCYQGPYTVGGEPMMFWQDLSAANLIAEGISTTAWVTCCGVTASANGTLDGSLPKARLGGGNYIYVYSNANTSLDYIGIAVPAGVVAGGYWSANTYQSGLTVSQAYGIDKKIDDGFPQSGSVQALYINAAAYYGEVIYSGVAISSTQDNGGLPFTTAMPGSASSCFDNDNSGGETQHYSLEQNNGAGLNCSLSLSFQ